MRAELISALEELQQSNCPFAIATVIEVEGSASARVGSRALFDERGANVYGWVGGGCAESFVGEQAVEALAAREPRTVLAHLDDEVFGLGVACGGVMRVFIEPHYPPERIPLARPDAASGAEELAFLLESLGLEPDWTTDTFAAGDLRALYLEAARAVAHALFRSVQVMLMSAGFAGTMTSCSCGMAQSTIFQPI